MTAPIILPPLKAAGFDLIWFGVLMTIVMETGLIHPPVGLNIFVIKNIAPDIPLARHHLGRACRSSALMFVAVVLICLCRASRPRCPMRSWAAWARRADCGCGHGRCRRMASSAAARSTPRSPRCKQTLDRPRPT